MENSENKLTSWAKYLNAIGNLSSKLIWGAVGLIILAGIGKYLIFSSHDSTTKSIDIKKAQKVETQVSSAVPWYEIDAQIVEAFKKSYKAAEIYADKELTEWNKDLSKRIDNDFLSWYFSYWQQQWMGLKGMSYWAAEKIFDDQPTMAEKVTEEIQDEFSKRVLRPQIAQMKIERIANETVKTYGLELSKRISAIQGKYQIPQTDWDRYLSEIALLTSGVEGSRGISLSLKAVTTTTAAGGTVVAVKLAKALKPLLAKIGTKMGGKAAAKGAGKAAAKVASKTGGKVAGKAGGKLLGPIIGIGIIVWDIWDHQHTKKIQKPILRQNLMDYLEELKQSLMFEPETGLMSIIGNLQSNAISSLNHT